MAAHASTPDGNSAVPPITDASWSAGPAPRHEEALPVDAAGMARRGWSECDIVIISGDAYVDHPSFGAALVGRFLESLGYRVGIIAQPDVTRIGDFRVLGRPRLFWGVTAGNVDSQLARLTVMRKLRSEDDYSPGGAAGLRPANASIVYTSLARQAFKGVPVVLGGVEASLRRFPYYDYWTDRVRRSIVFDAKADLLVHGMAERALAAVARRLAHGEPATGIAGTAYAVSAPRGGMQEIALPPYEEVAQNSKDGKSAFTQMTRTIWEQHRPGSNRALVQKHGTRWLVVEPPSLPLTTAEMDHIYSLPFTRRPHPRYGSERIPAFDMIRDSVTTHRGCYGGCSFCAIGAHQHASISSRSRDSIVREIKAMADAPGFRGTVSDIGGPTANMYGTGCRLGRHGCAGRTCLHPEICANLIVDPAPVIGLMKAARQVPGVRHVHVTSGIRYDLAMAAGDGYLRELIGHHVSGLLKVAPEHISDEVLGAMRKPPLAVYRRFVDAFKRHVRELGRRYAIVEYFISGHPGCTLGHMAELAEYLKEHGIRPEQVQDFYPAPLTLAAAMFHTGVDPLSGRRVHVPATDREKALQRALLLYHRRDMQEKAREALHEAGRDDLIGNGPGCLVPAGRTLRPAAHRRR